MAKFTITIEIFTEEFNIAHRLARRIIDNAHRVHDDYADEVDAYNKGPASVTMLSNYEWDSHFDWNKRGPLAQIIEKLRRLFT